ncbi:hypothetical protein NM688_g3660 [Phlebia brevispora]|uniref:Uncharacterized protein n=1 Tax=Phlebia brevispora TaxID=194682 RepID=A0ACC1T5I3_9APHY|nr:hypothetical protein NM688_g3660 [Phlebia brevispora]
MSNGTADPALVAALATNYSIFAALTLVSYEYIITFQHEYEFLKYRKRSAATWLFLANRCYNSALNTFLSVLYALPMFITAAFSALRIFALLGRAYTTSAIVLLLGLTPIALNLYQSSHATYYYVDDPILGSSCYYDFQLSPSTVFYCKKLPIYTATGLTSVTVGLASALSVVVADLVAIAATWVKTYKNVRQASAIGMNVPFSAMLLQYGTLFFTVLFVIALIDALFLLIPSFPEENPISVFLILLPNIIVSRFLINLRQASPAETSDLAHFSQFSAPNFRMPTFSNIIGDLGEPLADGNEMLDEEEHEVREDSAYAASSSVGEDASVAPDSDISEVRLLRASA